MAFLLSRSLPPHQDTSETGPAGALPAHFRLVGDGDLLAKGVAWSLRKSVRISHCSGLGAAG